MCETKIPETRPSAKVKRVAALLDVDCSVVRRMIERGEIEAHTVGKRGIRVFLDTVADFQTRQTITSRPQIRAAAQEARKQQSRSHRKAMEQLRDAGVLPPE